jgi:hypothetical protein
MLKHVVLFKFKAETTAADIDKLATRLGALPEIISEIREFVFGRDVVRSERSYDFGLVSSFDDRAALDAYAIHPDHQLVVVHVKQICSSVVAIDFEY